VNAAVAAGYEPTRAVPALDLDWPWSWPGAALGPDVVRDEIGSSALPALARYQPVGWRRAQQPVRELPVCEVQLCASVRRAVISGPAIRAVEISP
jgi:hypothetical protein